MKIALYDEATGAALSEMDWAFSDLPPGFEFRSDSAICWTISDGPARETPTELIINTITMRLTLAMPKLIHLSPRFALYVGYEDRPSGSSPLIKKTYVLMDLHHE